MGKLVKYRLAIQEYVGREPVSFRNVMVRSRKSIDGVQAIVEKTFNE